jgi:branched-chain amino acid transport system permease protein
MMRAALALLLLAFALLPFGANPGLVFIAGFALIEIVFALSWNLLFSYVGLVSFGHAAFFGVGAYTAAVALKYGLAVNFLLVLLAGAVLGAVAAFLVAIVVLRRASGIQFAVLTLALSQLAVTLIGYSDFLGHDEGLSALARPRMEFFLFSIDLNRPLAAYYFVLGVSLVALALMWLLQHGHLGRAMQAVRLDPERAAFVGIDVWRIRVFAFTVSGAFAAVAGGLLAHWGRIVTPGYVNWVHSAQPMFATLLGGAGSFWGPLIGMLALSALNYVTRTLTGLSEVLIGACLIVLVLVAPQGVLGFAQRGR